MALRSKLSITSKLLAQSHGSLFSGSRCFTVFSNRSLSPATQGNGNDQETHTGQVFDRDDYRLARFVDKKKEVNERFAIKLIDEIAPKEEGDRNVWCDGGGGPTGHPKVYINLDQPGNHTCGYCGLRFYKSDEHH